MLIINKHHFSLFSNHNKFLNEHSNAQISTNGGKKFPTAFQTFLKVAIPLYASPRAMRQTFQVDKESVYLKLNCPFKQPKACSKHTSDVPHINVTLDLAVRTPISLHR